MADAAGIPGRRRTSFTAIGDRVGLDGAALGKVSRLVAKVDSAAVQDGFDLYLHGFIVTDDGSWTIVQQGMNGDRKQARRYHWLSEGLQSFVDEPPAAIDGVEQGVIVNLTDRRAAASRQRQLDLLGSLGPDGIERDHQVGGTQNGAAAAGAIDAAPPDDAGPSRRSPRRRHRPTLAWQSGGRNRMRPS